MKKVSPSQNTSSRRTSQAARSGRLWTGADRMRLQSLAEHQVPAEKIARKLRRSEAAVRAEARKQRVMLAPAAKQPAFTDKRPYGGLRVADHRLQRRRLAPPAVQRETLF